MKKILIGAGLLVAAVPLTLLLLSSGTTLQVDPKVEAIGSDTPIRVRITNRHGIRRFTAIIKQNGAAHQVYEKNRPAQRFFFWRRNAEPQDITFRAGSKTISALRDGQATLLLEAQSNDFRAGTDSLATEVTVVTQPPRLAMDTAQHYINQGGSELVTFSVSGYWTEAGVRVGRYSFRGFALPGKPKDQRFSLFAFPWDMPAATEPVAYARNPAGTEVPGKFWFKVFPKKFRARDLVLDDAFLEKVVSQIDPGSTGDLLSRFLKINGAMRRENNQTLSDLRLKTEERFLWHGPFMHLAGAVESNFADVRTYIYKGKKVDHQVHLGFDLARTQNVPIEAANDGKVIYAAPLGIYGNCIVVDHGYGLQSIYGHLSEIGVKPDEIVKKGQAMGKSGSTGLAGGDHLHFSMQVDGVQVNPVEWWDEHWIHDRILSKIATEK